MQDYFPDIEEIPKCGKAWVKNMLRILAEDEFRAWVSQICKLHREKVDRVQKNNVNCLFYMTVLIGANCPGDCRETKCDNANCPR